MRAAALLTLLLQAAGALRWYALDAPAAPASNLASPGARAMALYPLPAVYLPGSAHVIRNVEQRNIAMCRERSEFVAAFLDSTDGSRSRCASVGAVLQIDDVRPAARDASGKVLTSSAPSKVLQVQCTVVGRARIEGCHNPEAVGKGLVVNKLTLEVDDRYSTCKPAHNRLTLFYSFALSLAPF